MVTTPGQIKDQGLLVIPGVGRFGRVVRELRESGFAEAITDWWIARKPLLGICSGMHAMFETSEEDPQMRGLGVVHGRIGHVGPGGRPRLGWYEVQALVGSQDDLVPNTSYYFAHSYGCDLAPFTSNVVRSNEGGLVSAAVRIDTFVGLQFHPEKSQRAGVEVLTRIARWAEQL